jgi:hypothetical protein
MSHTRGSIPGIKYSPQLRIEIYHFQQAVDYGIKNGLWAHAVLLGGLMDNKGNNSMLDSKTSSSIIMRYSVKYLLLEQHMLIDMKL